MNRLKIAKKVEESAMKLKSFLFAFLISAIFWGVSQPGVSLAQGRENVCTPESSIKEAVAGNWAINGAKEKNSGTVF